jgi:hypothetical protein
VALGNDRPRILLQLEDCIIHAIIGISEGKIIEEVFDSLYSQILLLEKDLENDDNALKWFNISTSSISTPSTPIPSELTLLNNIFKGGLASPPESHYNSPMIGVGGASSSVSHLSTPQYVNPGYLHLPFDQHLGQDHFTEQFIDLLRISAEASGHENERIPEDPQDDFTAELVRCLNGFEPQVMPRSRKSSIASSVLTDIDDEEPVIRAESSNAPGDEEKCDPRRTSSGLSGVEGERGEPMIDVESKKPSSEKSSESSGEEEEESSGEEEEEGEPMVGVESEGGEPMIDVESKKPSSETSSESSGEEEEEGEPMVGVESKKPSSEKSSVDASAEEEEGGEPMINIESKKPSSEMLSESSGEEEEGGEAMVGGESKKPSIESSSDLSDLEDEDPMNIDESIKLPLNSEPFVPRRSTRNVERIKHPSEPWVMPVKSWGGKRKSGPKKDDVPLLVSIQITLSEFLLNVI